MKSEINSLRYVPSTMNETICSVENKYEIFFTNSPVNGKFYVMAFSGKRKDHDIYYVYATEDQMKNRIDSFIKSCEEVEKYKADRKAAKKVALTNAKSMVKVGDIFVNSWGYDQTNVNAYQIVEAKGSTIKLKEIQTEGVKGTDGFMCCRVRPVKDAFVSETTFTKRIQSYGNEPYISFTYGSSTFHVEGKDYYCSWYA